MLAPESTKLIKAMQKGFGMKGLERTIWAIAVVILIASSVVLLALWKDTEGMLERTAYLEYMHLIRLQQALKSNDFDTAIARNQDRMLTYWNSFLSQKESNSLIISEKDFRKLKAELEETSILD